MLILFREKTRLPGSKTNGSPNSGKKGKGVPVSFKRGGTFCTSQSMEKKGVCDSGGVLVELRGGNPNRQFVESRPGGRGSLGINRRRTEIPKEYFRRKKNYPWEWKRYSGLSLELRGKK